MTLQSAVAGATGVPLRPRSRLRARLVMAGLSACGLAALTWASFVQPLPRLIYNPSDSVVVGWYRVEPLPVQPGSLPRPLPPSLRVGSIVLTRLPSDAAALAAQRGYLPARVPLLSAWARSRRSTCACSMRWSGSTAFRWPPFDLPIGWAVCCHPGRSADAFSLANCSC